MKMENIINIGRVLASVGAVFFLVGIFAMIAGAAIKAFGASGSDNNPINGVRGDIFYWDRNMAVSPGGYDDNQYVKVARESDGKVIYMPKIPGYRYEFCDDGMVRGYPVEGD